MSLRVLTPSILGALDSMMDDNRYQELVLKRDGSNLPVQMVRIAKVSQQSIDESEFISTGVTTVNIIGKTTLDIQVDDTFTWDDKFWRVVEPVVIGADNVTRTAQAVTGV